ncbi:MAG: glycosyltransferase family 4 protein [Acetobacteraceae bacterium]
MQTRDRLLVVFDEQYSRNGNVVHAATRGMIRQFGNSFQYDIFCKGRYRGPRFPPEVGTVRVIDPRAPRVSDQQRLKHRILSYLSRFRICDSPNRWLTNFDRAESRLLTLLFDVEQYHAIIVFAVNAEFGLRIARMAHIFSGRTIPHLVLITPEHEAFPDTLADLQWLRVKLLQDGRVLPPLDPTALSEQPTLPKETPGDDKKPTVKIREPVPIPFDAPRGISFLDMEFYPYQMTEVDTKVAWHDWIGPAQPLPERVRDVVLFIRPDWVNCGSGTLFESLARHFRQNDGLLIDVGIFPYAMAIQHEERRSKVEEEQRHIRAAMYFSMRSSTNLFHILAQLRHLFTYWPGTVSNQVLLQYALTMKPRMLREVTQRAKLTHIYLFHYFTYLYSKDMIAGRKFFLDTHDIQAINVVHHASRNVITRRGDQFQRLLEEEMRIVDMAHRIAFVSEVELDIVRRYIRPEKLEFIIPLPDIEPCESKPFAQPPRLLIIAARNPGNERNLAWFLDQVWPKVINGDPATKLAPIGEAAPHLDICGNIRDAFYDVDLPHVRFHGVVEDLRPFYEDADLVLLPVITGSGIAIKTIEALLHERPVLATRHALRGLPQTIVEAVGYVGQQQEYAQAIRELIDQPALLEERQQRSHAGAQLLRDQGFYQRLAAALEEVRVARADYRSAADVPIPPFLADPLGVFTPREGPVVTLTGHR